MHSPDITSTWLQTDASAVNDAMVAKRRMLIRRTWMISTDEPAMTLESGSRGHGKSLMPHLLGTFFTLLKSTPGMLDEIVVKHLQACSLLVAVLSNGTRPLTAEQQAGVTDEALSMT